MKFLHCYVSESDLNSGDCFVLDDLSFKCIVTSLIESGYDCILVINWRGERKVLSSISLMSSSSAFVNLPWLPLNFMPDGDFRPSSKTLLRSSSFPSILLISSSTKRGLYGASVYSPTILNA